MNLENQKNTVFLKEVQMNKKVYFAGSIRGGRADANLYHEIIEYIKKDNIVLTEHVGNIALNSLEQGRNKDSEIYSQDMNWLRQSDILIAECTCPSLGVGYELAFAEKMNIPCYVFYRKERCELSAMITGDPYFIIYPYSNKDELFSILDTIL